MATIRQQITDVSISLLEQAPDGIRWADLCRAIKSQLPNVKPNNVAPNLNVLIESAQGVLIKPSKGLFLHVKHQKNQPDEKEIISKKKIISENIAESFFYEPFSDWLVGSLQECTKAIPLGGNSFSAKWGTPDVIGVLKSKANDVISFPTEIVAVEIKTNDDALIVAFGQACAYKLFAHRSYIAIPKTAKQVDIDRLESLAIILGIGLVLFDAARPENPDFQIKTRATLHQPDMFYVNQIMRGDLADTLLG